MAGWLEPTITLFPLALWMFAGVGIPWALVLLPREDWADHLTVIALGLALGPLGLTAVMFLLGTFARITFAGTMIGSGLLAAVGLVLAWRRRGPPSPTLSPPGGKGREGWNARLDIALIAGIALILLISTLITAYWPFVAYDPLWVYGYNAKVFFIEQHIPSEIGYYPQMLPLSYTFMQQAWGGINDHAARVVVPWFTGVSILMAYVLGQRAFRSARVGLLTAAVWAFYPHMVAWSGAGDLEIPLTLYVTGAAAFFIEAWRTGRTRAAVISGVLLGGALWTKPTGGALALGIGLAVAGWAVWNVRRREALPPRREVPLPTEWARGLRVNSSLGEARSSVACVWPKLRLALVAGLACAPLGGMWYVRNLLLGHNPVDFPASYWHDYAQRSGQELGWPLLIAALIAGGLAVTRRGWRRALPLLALALLLIGALPTALNLDLIGRDGNLWQWVRGDLSAGGRLNAVEWALILAGAALLLWSGRDVWRGWPAARRETVLLILALLLPYAAVWFLNFSYHYRLSFAIVPLFAVLVAALLDGWLLPWLTHRRIGRMLAWVLIFGAVALAAAAGLEFSASYWLKGGLPDDRAKYDSANPALMVVVHALEDYAAEHGEPVVSIPGEDRLPFFFPGWDIRNSREDLPTRLEDLDGVDIFVENSVAVFLMQRAGLWPNSLLADAAVGAAYHQVNAIGPDGQPWPTVLEPIPLHPTGALPVDDGNFRYAAFTVHPEARTAPMNPVAPAGGEVIIGGFARYVGHDVTTLTWAHGQNVYLSLYWQPTEQAPPPRDYSVYIHLLTPEGDRIAGWDGVPLQGAYPTRFWRPGESLLDYWILRLPDDLPPGPAHLKIGLYDPISGERLPVVVDGETVGDGLIINERITVP